MDLKEAIEKARLILNEEETRPTVKYRYVSNTWPREMIYEASNLKSQGYTPSMAGEMGLRRTRDMKRPRPVYENPNDWVFESTNYGLIMTLFSQLIAGNRPLFIKALLTLTVEKYVPRLQPIKAPFPAWNGHASALPLVSEFCIRNSSLSLLIEALDKVKLPTPSIAGMVRELEEMISVNFDVFSDAELEAMPKALAKAREIAEQQTWSSKGRAGGTQVQNPHYRQGFSAEGTEIVEGIDAFLQQCAQARFWYLKGALQQSRNPEIEGDKKTVEDFLTTLGFNDLMVKSLNAAERDFKDTATAFELKNAMGHLRSFLEQLHLQACALIIKPTEILPDKWGAATIFLRQRDVITLKEEEFITKLYTLVSDEGIHPLIAAREYARLFRNIVIEYGLLFLTALQKKNLTIKGP